MPHIYLPFPKPSKQVLDHAERRRQENQQRHAAGTGVILDACALNVLHGANCAQEHLLLYALKGLTGQDGISPDQAARAIVAWFEAPAGTDEVQIPIATPGPTEVPS